MANNSTSTYEQVNGPAADMYASQYGIPTGIFRDVIRQVSNFDPHFAKDIGGGKNSMGIAGLDNSEGSVAFNPFDVGASLNVAAQTIKAFYADTGDWSKAAKMYLGSSDAAVGDKSIQYDAMGNTTGQEAEVAPGDKASKSLWQYSMDDVKTFLTNSAYGFMIGAVGVILVVGSVWFLMKSAEK